MFFNEHVKSVKHTGLASFDHWIELFVFATDLIVFLLILIFYLKQFQTNNNKTDFVGLQLNRLTQIIIT